MTREELRAALEKQYQRTQWVETLAGILPAVEWFAQAQPIPDGHDGVESIFQLGKVPLAGGRALAILEVRTGAGIDVPRNRVALRKLVAKYIDQATYHGVLAVFYSTKKPEYRLTLAARESTFDDNGQLIKQETAPRRYTFVLGPGEPCATAAERLQALAEKGKSATLVDVVDAFSVERLNKEFFKRYKEHYERFVDHLVAGDTPLKVFGIPVIKDAEEYDRTLKPVRDFAKKLLGRLVFLHFLQKKGWLGCPAGVDGWADGEPDFLAKLFNTAPDKNHFYSARLVPLFFDALNRRDRQGDVFEPTGTRVPYLNGGLFEDDLPQTTHDLNFPATLFDELLAFFAEYNFTIDENDPEDHEVGIDPEMLGHVFENLLEDNKDKGAYYTPKAIVQYMCQQSLVHYLQSHLGQHAELVELVRNKDPGEAAEKRNWVRQNAKEIERLLDEVKICDPAIGSGAFPIGLLQEIYWIKLTLDWTLDRAETKRRIIQQSIYGVDIDAGAVEIARLRFWLALIVEEDQPTPLPNLDYKIMQGDSLLESFDGIALDHLFRHDYAVKVFAGQGAFAFETEGTQLTIVEQQREDLGELMDGYFAESDASVKQDLHRRIDVLVLTHIEHSIQAQAERFEIELQQYRADVAAKKRKAKGWQPPTRTAKRLTQLEAELKLCVERWQKLKALEDKPERPYFLWHMYFQDVFERGGFDIVIANPPYVLLQKQKKNTAQYGALKDAYEVASYKVDLYHLFIERGVRLARSGGVVCYITPSNFLTNNYTVGLRKLLLELTAMQEILVFEDSVFAASVNNLLFLTLNTSHNGGSITFSRGAMKDGELRISNGSLVKQQDVATGSYLLIPPGAPGTQELLQRIESQGRLLGGLAAVNFGMQLRDRKLFKNDVLESPLDIEKLGPDYRQCISGKDIKRYAISYASRYCLFNRIAKKGGCWDESVQFAKNKLVLRQIGAFPEAAIDERGFPVLNNSFMVTPHDKNDAWFLLAAINSSVIRFFWTHRFKDDRKTFPKIKGEYLKLLAIPEASQDDKQALSDLSKWAMRAAGAELADVERKIDRIVYRLFELSPDDIILIEAGTGEPKQQDAKSLLLGKIVPDLFSADAYLSFERIALRLDELQIDIEHDTLRSYLSEAMQSGVIHDAGRSWYSRLAEPFALDTKPLAPLLKLIKKDFPLLDFSAWSTAQINPYAHHLLSTHTTFVYAEADALPSLAETLEDRGWKVYLNPTPSEAEQRFRPADKTVVLRPTLSKQPEGEGGAAPIEKLLVDLLVEADRLGLMDEAEAQRVLANVAQSGRISVAALLGYAQRRGKVVSFFEGSTKSRTGDEMDLMDQE